MVANYLVSIVYPLLTYCSSLTELIILNLHLLPLLLIFILRSVSIFLGDFFLFLPWDFSLSRFLWVFSVSSSSIPLLFLSFFYCNKGLEVYKYNTRVIFWPVRIGIDSVFSIVRLSFFFLLFLSIYSFYDPPCFISIYPTLDIFFSKATFSLFVRFSAYFPPIILRHTVSYSHSSSPSSTYAMTFLNNCRLEYSTCKVKTKKRPWIQSFCAILIARF